MLILENRSIIGYGAADYPRVTLDGGATYVCTLEAFRAARSACRSGTTVHVGIEGDIVRAVIAGG